jgi:MYXO-CTERM domain-containing protein
MVCYEQKITQCAGSSVPAIDCAPNTKCSAPEPPVTHCTDVSVKQCLPRYVLPCEQDNDCGAGFTCQASEECNCTIGGGDPGSAPVVRPAPAVDGGTAASSGLDAAVAPVPPPLDGGVETPQAADGGSASGGCECHPSAIKHCELKAIQCQSDNDCPSNFTCNSYATGTASCAVAKDADAAACAPVEMTLTEEKRCEPRYINGYGSVSGHAQAASDSGSTTKNGTPTVSAPSRGAGDAGAAEGGEATDSGTPASMPAAESGGCSVSGPGQETSASGYLIGVLLMGLGLRSRRRQR